jgi:hypothetical protein
MDILAIMEANPAQRKQAERIKRELRKAEGKGWKEADAAHKVSRSTRRNEKVETHEGDKFDSKLEYHVYQRMVAEGLDVIRQVSIPVGRNPFNGKPIRMVLDFMEILEVREDGTAVIRLLDAKGIDRKTGEHRTEEKWKLKAAMLEQRHGLSVKIIHE